MFLSSIPREARAFPASALVTNLQVSCIFRRVLIILYAGSATHSYGSHSFFASLLYLQYMYARGGGAILSSLPAVLLSWL